MKKIILVILFSFFSVISFAQSKHTDPRKMKGLDASKIPILKSFSSIKPNPGGFLNGAVELGRAEWVTTDIGPSQLIAKNSENSAPNNVSLWRILRAANGTANWMWRTSTKQNGITTQSISSSDGIEILNGVKNALRISDPKSEFYPMSAETDEVGCKHLRYGQMYKGVPVWNRDLYIHLDLSGEPNIINGTYEPTPVNITTVPAITNPYSILVAIADLKAQNKWAPVGPDVAKVLGRGDPSATLVIYPGKDKKLHLAYEVSIIPNLIESYYYIIDATSGEILNTIARQCSVMPIDPKMPPVTLSHFASSGNGIPLQPQTAGFTNASGTDLNGVTQQLRTYQHTDGKYYAIWDLKSFDPNSMSKLPDQPIGGAITLSTNTQPYDQNATLFHNTSTNNSWSDSAVVSAHHNTLVTYTYYSNTFARKAIDDKNSLITSIIHVTNKDGSGLDNAFWDGVSSMIYGDGKTDFKPLAGGIDVAAHEMTHGVINSTCNLVYQDQSGALNESFADVFGVLVDTRNLTVGEDIMKDGKSCLRNLDNPHDPTALSDEPAKFSQYNPTTQDNGGVHTNSAITSKAAAILINQLGRPTVQKIYYLAMTKYLTRNSQFVDCRIAIQSAAKELFGGTSTEFNAVGPAFDAVEITGPGTDPGKNDVPGESGGTSLIAFTNNVGDIGMYNPALNKFILPGTPGSTARVSENGASRAQITAPRNGTHLWYISTTGHLNVMDVTTGVVNSFPNLKLQSDGDLWNAAVSPDETYVALSSAYLNDPNIYIYEIATQKIFTQPLTPQSNDGGAIASINYPDVISVSPNKTIPRISFDALLDAKVGTDSIQYWSIYEINYDLKSTYELFPSRGSAIDLGNIAYSNTSPSIITFNSITNGNDWDVWIADFKNNNTGFLGVDKRTINGNPVLDAQKPSFSPHDDSLVFASPSNNSMLFYKLSDQSLSFVTFPSAVYQPYWFIIGASGVRNDNNSSAALTLAVYPSISLGNATATFTLSTSEEVALDIVNIYGMTVRPITKQRLDAGSHEVKFSTEKLSSGTYFIRITTKEGQKMEKFVVEK